MFKAVSAISALLLATSILYAGNGLQSTLLSLRANLEGFPTALIGALMSAYFVGFIAGCRFGPGVIKSAGHIRAFVSFASVASASALAHALVVDVFVWAGLRIVTGFCFAGLAMVLESWINERATNEIRGRILSIYRIVDLGALAVGNALLTLASPSSFHLFAVVSILISIALVPVALTRSDAPKPIKTARLDIGMLFSLSPVAALCAPLGGLGNAAFWAVGPVYAQRLGYDAEAIAAFIGAAILGAAAFQWPIGWLSDRIDRRVVLAGSSFFGVLSAYGVAELGGMGLPFLAGAGFFLGASIIPSFGLCAAHANDHADPQNAVATNGGLLLLHGAGSAIGATAGAGAMSVFGPPALFLYIAGVYSLVLATCIIRILSAPPVPTDRKSPFRPVAKNAAPTVFDIEDDEVPDDDGPRQSTDGKKAASRS